MFNIFTQSVLRKRFTVSNLAEHYTFLRLIIFENMNRGTKISARYFDGTMLVNFCLFLSLLKIILQFLTDESRGLNTIFLMGLERRAKSGSVTRAVHFLVAPQSLR